MVQIKQEFDVNKTYPVFIGNRCVEVLGDRIPSYIEKEMTFAERLLRVELSLARAGLLINVMEL